MFNKTKRVFAIVLALALVFSLAGCKQAAEDEGSVEYIIEEEIVYEDGGSTGNNQDGQTGNQSGGNQSGGSTQNGDYAVNLLTQAELDALRGSTVKFAATIRPQDDGTQYVIDSFEKKYGMKVEIVFVEFDTYIQDMQGLIANGQSPDVGRSNGDFPACVAYLDSLDKAKIDQKNDSIWNQTTFQYSTINGQPYMCDTYGCYWTELDICIYSKSLLKAAGCPTPQELAAQGNWTWDTFMEIARQCTKQMGAPAGCIFTPECAVHMGGGNVFKFENEKIVSGIDAKTTAVIKKYDEAYKEGILNTKSTTGISQGITAIGTGHAWSLRKDGDLAAQGASLADIGFYYLPSYTAGGEIPATGIFRGWGVVRGSKNPAAAGVFLRHYLDVENYDTQNAFINEDAKTFFFQLTGQDYGKNYNPYLTYIGLSEEIAGIKYNSDIYSVVYKDPSAVDAQMAAVKKAVEKGADNLNKHINQYVYSN
ncbi:MAG: extracellular solute-binding protein [Clostridia bacterium]|nr:extracellular solute-binding protein [Clostridia bacterium]